ncbi:class II aldolase/adducin family protein [Anaeromicropila populeti]|uniref:L-fuculose-phosphate aldolase n=1 Tax=Anaeromicropila populeti TaxID=37658 RepID=A0A1I6K8E7_9FIRM|nr:class II aldolase/adducin family protein [Anaeromicropila populeti]SFR87511.1 L-fuculose-phosphate aldolase [Anaeromicropila populeti]
MVIQGVKYSSDFEAKKAIIEASKRLNEKGYAIGGDGSLSVRVGPNAVWITVAGADKCRLAQDMMVRIDLNGKQMMGANQRQLPEDLPVHLKVYGENDKVQGIIHAYPPMVNVMAICGKSIEKAGFSPAVRALGSAQNIQEMNGDSIAQKVALLCKADNGVLLQNDGCMFWGTSVMEAFYRVEAAEYYAKVASELENRVFPTCENNVLPVEHHLKGVTQVIHPQSKSIEVPIVENQNIEIPLPVKDMVMQEVVKRVMMQMNK